jgi:hypothetical protein
VEVVVTAVEQRRLPGHIPLPARFDGGFDRPQLGGRRVRCGEPARRGLLDAAELEQHVHVVEAVGRKNPPQRDEPSMPSSSAT